MKSCNLIELSCGDSRATIALRGAELRSWQVGPRSLIWDPDPAIWAETAPILFPVVGWTRDGQVRIGGRSYPLGLHGFARDMRFRIVSSTADRVALQLVSDNSSRRSFPFEFRLTVDYWLRPGGLFTSLCVENCGPIPMPYACGLHPGFCWPFAGGERRDYVIRFGEPEGPEVPEISDRGLFLPNVRQIPIAGRELALTPELFAHEALCFLNARSRALRFEHESGAAISVTATDFPHFALWAKADASFLSVECWTGHGDPDGFDGDLFAKPFMRVLEPGGRGHHVANYEWSEPTA
jgi:galactose mutarotase-like enzyme